MNNENEDENQKSAAKGTFLPPMENKNGKMENIRQITFNIYASSDEEAERGRKAIVNFINIVGQQGAKVSGDKLHEAVSKLPNSPFVFNQIVKFFKR